MMYIFYIVTLIFLSVEGRESINKWIQQPIDKYAVNFRTLNGTHKFGSSSSQSGTYGVVHVLNGTEDVDWLISKAVAGPYIAVLTPTAFVKEVMDLLVASDKIAGVVVILPPDSDIPSNYSFDSTCPNQNFGGENCPAVNPYGNFFMLTDWPIPVTLVNNAEGVKIINDCFLKFNTPLDDSQLSRRLCSLHMKNHMFAPVNSEVCMRRSAFSIVYNIKYCDPMGGQNIVLPLGNFRGKGKSTVIISTRLDVASIFDGVAPGAMSSVTSIVTVMTTAHLLTKMLPRYDLLSDAVFFTLLNGEAYDYIGSSRLVYDMERGLFPRQDYPLSPDEVDLFVDISQLKNSALYVHKKNDISEKGAMFIDSFQRYIREFGLDLNGIVDMKPYLPSSYQSFSKVFPNLTGMVITSYEQTFVNKYYHGLFDDAKNIGYTFKNGSDIDKDSIQDFIGKTSQALALTLYKILTGKEYPYRNVTGDRLADELLHCYLESNRCKYMKAVITNSSVIKKGPESLYVGVGRGSDLITKLTGTVLAYLTAPVVSGASASNCTNNGTIRHHTYIWMNGLSGHGVCINTSLKFTPAISPAFDIENYNWSSSKYSTWTESSWSELDLYLFLKPPPTQDIVTLASGLIVMSSSFIILYFINKNQLKIQLPSNNVESF